jgi:DNA-binding transcriptional ArsR family regulator
MQVVRPERHADTVALRFAVVPAYDLIISLAAAAHPDRYELSASWSRQVRQALPPGTRADLRFFFGDPYGLGVGAIQLIPDLLVADSAPFVDYLAHMDAADFVGVLLSRGTTNRRVRPALRRLAAGKTLSAADDAAVKELSDGFRAATRKRFWAILDDPRSAHRRYTSLLRDHESGWFRDTYSEIMPLLQQRVKQGRRVIGKLPTKEVIARLTGGFTLQDPATRSAVLIPSYYAAPFVFVVRGGRDVVLVYGTRPAEDVGRSLLDAQTVRVLKALADETRLRILQMLAQRPLYGQQIAESLGLSHPTVSHHMAQLRIAGLTRTELAEDGSKTYWVRPETIDALCTELRGAFVSELPSFDTRPEPAGTN